MKQIKQWFLKLLTIEANLGTYVPCLIYFFFFKFAEQMFYRSSLLRQR